MPKSSTMENKVTLPDELAIVGKKDIFSRDPNLQEFLN